MRLKRDHYVFQNCSSIHSNCLPANKTLRLKMKYHNPRFLLRSRLDCRMGFDRVARIATVRLGSFDSPLPLLGGLARLVFGFPLLEAICLLPLKEFFRSCSSVRNS